MFPADVDELESRDGDEERRPEVRQRGDHAEPRHAPADAAAQHVGARRGWLEAAEAQSEEPNSGSY